jgi:predicted outer membrane repeat protein
VIGFDPMVFGTTQTITLGGSELVIGANGTLDIVGPGANLLTISGGNASRILSTGIGVVAAVSDITFTEGNGAGALNTGRGGAIYNPSGNLTLNNVVVTGNTASNGGGINNAAATGGSGGMLTMHQCIVSNNISSSSGGGMQNFSTSTVVIYDSTFSGNLGGSTTGGGGAQLNGTVRITNSTFSNNTATAGSGGGIQSNGSNQILTNVTFVGNSSVTNGGGIHRGTTNVNFFIRNSIVAGNNGTATSPDVTNSAGGISSEGSNIIGVVGTSTGWIGSDLVDTDPLLGPLQDNGGPTLTHTPMAGSPAIDAGDDCVLDLSCATNNPPLAVTADQRASLRPMGPSVDIGSVEAASIASVSGRFVSSAGPIPGALVTISDMQGVVQSGYTNSFGYFMLTGIPTGQTYELGALTKQYIVCTQSIGVNTNVTGITLTTTGPAVKGFKFPNSKVETVGCLK